MRVARARQAEILERARLRDAPTADDGLDVTVPPLRREDVTREVDLIEEVARIDGLERLPATLPARRGAYGAPHRTRSGCAARAVDALVGRGLYEIVGWTFTAPGAARPPASGRRRPAARGAGASRTRCRRSSRCCAPTLLGSLLDAAAHNLARGVDDLRLFESAPCSARRRSARGPAGVPRASRARRPAQRRACTAAAGARPTPPDADFYAVKAHARSARRGAARAELELAPAREPFLHPGRCGTTGADAPARATSCGWLGELHPLVAARVGALGRRRASSSTSTG